MLSVTVEKPGFVQENPGAPADNTEPCVPPSYFFLGSCWPCRTPGAFWPEGESRRGRGMKFIDEEGKGVGRNRRDGQMAMRRNGNLKQTSVDISST